MSSQIGRPHLVLLRRAAAASRKIQQTRTVSNTNQLTAQELHEALIESWLMGRASVLRDMNEAVKAQEVANVQPRHHS